MPSDKRNNTVAIALTVIFVIGVLLYGVFVIQQLLLSGLIALFGILVYILWRFLR